MYEFPQLNTKQLYDKYLETNPRSIPPMNRFSQLLKCKWFVNIGLSDEIKNNKRNRYAIWEIKQEFRDYPPQWTPRSGSILHHGGKENYPGNLDQLNDDLQSLLF